MLLDDINANLKKIKQTQNENFVFFKYNLKLIQAFAQTFLQVLHSRFV